MLSSLRSMAEAAAPEVKMEHFKWDDVQSLVYSPEAKVSC